MASTTTAVAAPRKGFKSLTASPSPPTKTPWLLAKMEPSALKVVRENTLLATFLTADGCAKRDDVKVRMRKFEINRIFFFIFKSLIFNCQIIIWKMMAERLNIIFSTVLLHC